MLPLSDRAVQEARLVASIIARRGSLDDVMQVATYGRLLLDTIQPDARQQRLFLTALYRSLGVLMGRKLLALPSDECSAFEGEIAKFLAGNKREDVQA